MKIMITGIAAGLVLLLTVVTLSVGAGAQDTVIQSLRGETAIDEANTAPEVKRQAAERWVSAVNSDGQHGFWLYAVAKGLDKVGIAIAQAAAT